MVSKSVTAQHHDAIQPIILHNFPSTFSLRLILPKLCFSLVLYLLYHFALDISGVVATILGNIGIVMSITDFGDFM